MTVNGHYNNSVHAIVTGIVISKIWWTVRLVPSGEKVDRTLTKCGYNCCNYFHLETSYMAYLLTYFLNVTFFYVHVFKKFYLIVI